MDPPLRSPAEGHALRHKLHHVERPVRIKAKPGPDLAALFFASAFNHHNSGRQVEAIAAYDAALRANPYLVEAHSNRSAALLGLLRWREAVAAADAALALRADLVEARCNRATALVHLGRFIEAVADLDVALSDQDRTSPRRISIEEWRSPLSAALTKRSRLCRPP